MPTTRNFKRAIINGAKNLAGSLGVMSAYKLHNIATSAIANSIASAARESVPKIGSRPTISRRTRGRTYKRSIAAKTKRKRTYYRKKAKGALRKKIKTVVKSTLNSLKNVSTYRKHALLDQKIHFNDKDLDYYIVGARYGDANNAPFSLKACKFTPNSMERLADAAAVLFNAKLMNYDPTIETDNFNPTTTKFHVPYASYRMHLRNNTNIGFLMEMIEVTNKVNEDSAEFFQTVSDLKDLNSIVSFPTALNVSTASDNIYSVTKNLKFSDIKELSQRYSINKIASKFMNPGETFTKTWTTKNQIVDLKKGAQTTALISDYVKGDKQIILKITPRLGVVRRDGVDIHGITSYGTPDSNYAMLGVEIEEIYKIAQPDNTADANEGVKTKILNYSHVVPPGSGGTLQYLSVPSWKHESGFADAQGFTTLLG